MFEHAMPSKFLDFFLGRLEDYDRFSLIRQIYSCLGLNHWRSRLYRTVGEGGTGRSQLAGRLVALGVSNQWLRPDVDLLGLLRRRHFFQLFQASFNLGHLA